MMDRKDWYGVVMSTTDRMTLSWLILKGKQICSRKIRRMRRIGEFDRREMDAWVNKLNRIKELEKVLEEML